MTAERIATVNALVALLRVVDLGIDARKALTGKPVGEICRWRTRDEELATATARAEAVRLAKRVTALDEDIAANSTRVNASQAAPLLDKTGVRPVTAAICLTAWSHHGRVRSEAAFACLTGRSPPRRATPSATGSTAAVTGA